MSKFFYRCLALYFLIAGATAQAQQTRETYGTNRIQYRTFNWSYISTENFDIFYYDNRKRVAEDAANFLEGEFDRITDMIGYPPYLKTKIFLYNSVSELRQSNVGLQKSLFSNGGETDFVKPYVEIAHPGTVLEFKDELLLRVSELLVNEMMFGGSLKDMFQSSVLLNLPEWFIRGVSRYVAYGWDSEMDDFARQLVKSKKLMRATNLTGKDAALVGQSIWNYIVEKYGKSSLSNILNYSRVIRNEERSILITLGIPYRQLMSDWRQFYLASEQKVSTSYVFPSGESKFSPRHRKTAVYTMMKISPDGKYFAYAENDRGKFVVKVKNIETGREIAIINAGLKVLNQAVDYKEPILGWADEHTLGVIGKEKGDYTFWLYDLNTRSKLPRTLDKFNNIRSFSFSSNGRLMVLSAEQDGKNDLFLLSSRRDRTRRLTNDIFDDLDPSFIPGTNSIVFSSNRTTDTLNAKSPALGEVRTEDYNLYSFNLDSTTNTVTKITNSLGRDFSPVAEDANTFYYLSDQRGITNLFKFNSRTKIYSQLTNFAADIKEYDYEFNTNTLAVVMTKKMSEDIFVVKDLNRNSQVFTPATRRQEALTVKQIVEKRKANATKNMSLKELINQRMQEKAADTVKADTTRKAQPPENSSAPVINTDNYTFEDAPPQAAATKVDTVKTTPAVSAKPISTEDYKFEDEDSNKPKTAESFLSKYIATSTESKTTGPFPYENKFSYESVAYSLLFDPLRGASMRFETQMNDMLENYRLYGGIQFAFSNVSNGDVFAEFQYLPKRIDYGIRVDRKVINLVNGATDETSGRDEKYSFQKLELTASYPIFTRLRISAKPFVSFTRYVDKGIKLPTSSGGPTFLPSQEQFYGGLKGELVYDNSVTTGLNIIEGTRIKLAYINNQAFGNADNNFQQAFIDARHYQKIYKEIVLAVRGYGGSFFGNAPKKYLLGGMDNWLFNKVNEEGLDNPLSSTSGFNQDIVFAEFLPLRGFNYSTFYGANIVMASVEFRVPLIRALAGGPIASNFFRNLQLTSFYDVGTSWSGEPPFGGEKSVRTRKVGGGSNAYEIEINEFLNPWLSSYGFGFRSVIFGYFAKFDLAWPVENYEVKNPRLQVTLGFDF